MDRIFSSKLFWVVVAAVTLIVFLVLINTQKLVKAESQIIIIPKSDLASKNFESIMANALNLPQTLSFYELILENNSKINSEVRYSSLKEKKEFWNSRIETSRVASSGIVKITIFDTNSAQAKIIAQQSAIDLATVLSRYYNIKTDLDVRIIEEPIATTVIFGNFLAIFFKSLLAGLLAGFIDYFIISLFPKSASKRRPVFSLKMGNIDFSRPEAKNKEFTLDFSSIPENFVFKPELSNALRESKEVFSEKDKADKEKKIEKPPFSSPAYFSSAKKAPAPSNLPVAADTPAIAEKKIAEKDKKTEKPSEEDVKERLNKLLEGQL